MENKSRIKAEEYGRKRKGRAMWKRVVSFLMAVTVFVTTYALILPAITQENRAYCGREEHVHSIEAGCYTEVRELICGLEEGAEPHIHSDSCYTGREVLLCGLEEAEAHTHTDACYADREVLLCGLEESEGHTHADSCYSETERLVCELTGPEHVHGPECYETARELACGQEEAEGHAHSEACRGTEKELICGLEENEGHAHDETCRGTERVLSCGLEEGAELPGHVHTDACYKVTYELTCKKEEHTHTLACYSDPTADVENASVWERTMKDVELTGVWADDVLAIAQTQLGYTESAKNYAVSDKGEMKGWTRYGAWYGYPYDDWCAMFVSFCLNYAGVDRESMPFAAGCAAWIETLTEKELYRAVYNALMEEEKAALLEEMKAALIAEGKTEEAEALEALPAYLPVPGDLVFFDMNKDGRADHVGLVSELLTEDDASVTAALKAAETEEETAAAEALVPARIGTIEGNASGRVKKNVYDLDNTVILGYGQLPEKPEEPGAENMAADDPEDPGAAGENENAAGAADPEAAAPAVLTAVTAEGVTVVMTAPAGSLPYPAQELTLFAEAVENEAAVALVEGGLPGEGDPVRRQTLLFDVRLMHGEEEVQPTGPVSVTFAGIETPRNDAQVFHVDMENEAVEDVTAEPAAPADPELLERLENEVLMETDHFSLYAVTFTYTVDFYYGEYEYHIPGEGSIWLSELFEQLHIDRDVADVVRAEFTDPALLSVEQQDNAGSPDWLLTSLAPFITAETLTVTFENGDVIAVRATDAASGTWGTCAWTLDNSGVLTINAGTMGAGTPPWAGTSSAYASQVKRVRFVGNVVANANSFGLFHNCQNLTRIDFGSFNTANVTNMQGMFLLCSSLTSLDLSRFNTAKVTNMNRMFQDCNSLTSLDLSSFNTAKVTTMQHMFYRCRNLVSLNLSSFSTENVTDFGGMFAFSSKLSNLDLSSFRTQNAVVMESMFESCASLASLDVSHFNTSRVTDFNTMFGACNFDELDLRNFDTGSAQNIESFFPNIRTRILLGNGFSLLPKGPYSTGFISGTWLRQEEDRVYTAAELSASLQAGVFPGTYIRQTERSFQPEAPATYRIVNMADNAALVSNSNPSVLLVSGSNGAVSLHLTGLAQRDYASLSVPGTVKLLYSDAAVDADGNPFDVEITVSNITLYNLKNSGLGETEVWVRPIYGGRTAGFYTQQPLWYRDEQNLQLINFPAYTGLKTRVAMRILNKDGRPAEGTFTYGASDVDMPSYLNTGETKPSTLGANASYGNLSEGVNLISGFDMDTLTLAEDTYLWQMGNSASAQWEGYRITGSQSDSQTEHSLLMILGDAQGAVIDYTTTWGSAATVHLADLQPNAIYLQKTDRAGSGVAGASLALYKDSVAAENLIQTWTSETVPGENAGDPARPKAKGFFLAPGDYVLVETQAPAGYAAAADIAFRVDLDYKVHILESGGTTRLVELVSMVDELSPVDPGGSVHTEKRVDENPDAIGTESDFLLTLKTWVDAQELAGPAKDIVLVLDQSASMQFRVSETETPQISRTAMTAENASIEGYYCAYDYNVPANNDPVHYAIKYVEGDPEGPWQLSRRMAKYYPFRVADSITKYPDAASLPAGLRYYETRMGATVTAIRTLLRVLEESGADHRIALAGFSGPPEPYTEFYSTGYFEVPLSNGQKYPMNNYLASGYYRNGDYHPIRGLGQNVGYAYSTGEWPAVTFGQDAFVTPSTNEATGILQSLRAMQMWLYTSIDTGFLVANSILRANPLPAGSDRERVVILLTDGAQDGWLEEATAGSRVRLDQVVERAWETKNTYGAEVYTIRLTGAGEDYMHYASSQHPDARGSYNGGTLTARSSYSFTWDTEKENTDKTYAFDAQTKEALNEIFAQIAENVIYTELDASAVVQDVLTADFDLPAGVTAENVKNYVKVYTEDYLGSDTWSTAQTDITSSVTVSLAKSDAASDRFDTVRVTGFDFSANYPREANGGDPASGKRLVVKIPINASESNPGGIAQATNVEAPSGVYKGPEDSTPLKNFPVPHVDVPVTVTVKKVVDGTETAEKFDFTYSADQAKFAATNGSDSRYSDLDAWTGKAPTDSNYLQLVTETVTDAAKQLGHEETFSFEALPGADISVAETVPEDYGLRVTVNGEYAMHNSGAMSWAVPAEGVEGRAVSIVFTNIRHAGKVIIHKTNAETGEPMSGITFTVYAPGGAVVGVGVTGPDGKCVIEGIPYLALPQVYTVKETLPPGFEPVADQTFSAEWVWPENGFVEVPDILVGLGTAQADIGLPASVTLMRDGQEVSVAVSSWTALTAYDPNTDGVYVFQAVLADSSITYEAPTVNVVVTTSPETLGGNNLATDPDKVLRGGTASTFMGSLPFATVGIDASKIKLGNATLTADSGYIKKGYTYATHYPSNIPPAWCIYSDYAVAAGESDRYNNSYTVTFKDAAIFSDGSRGDVKVTGSGMDIYAPWTDTRWPILMMSDEGTNYTAFTGFGETLDHASSVVAVQQKITYSVVGAGEHDTLIYSYRDIDQPDKTVTPYVYREYWDESVRVVSGAQTPAVIPAANFLKIKTNGNTDGFANGLTFMASREDGETYYSGFAFVGKADGTVIDVWASGAGTGMFESHPMLRIRAQYKGTADTDWTWGTARGGIIAYDTASSGAATFHYTNADGEWATRFAGNGKVVPIHVDPAPEGYTRRVTVDGTEVTPVNNMISVTMDTDHDVIVEYVGDRDTKPPYTETTLYFQNTPIHEPETVTLELTKTVAGEGDGTFPFTVALADAGSPADLSGVTVTLYDEEDAEITSPDPAVTVNTSTGVIGFSLKNGHRAEISGIPKDSTATVTETSYDGYTVLYKRGNQQLASGNVLTLEMSENREAECVNNPGVKLPDTGGPGTIPYTLAGLLLVGAALLCGLCFRRRRKGGYV
ncbi:MAG: BspA family leucine-rich repeat surface protein [Lachnospiraceae bacterium]|nr:BspA family leucine-rich repeat surface protein [Lachnospiraceae bacterium]